MTDRPSLTDGLLDEVWSRARARLERHGLDRRGRLQLPADLSSAARHRLGVLTGRAPGAIVDLAAVERGLVELGVGVDLPNALAALGHPVSAAPAARRVARHAARQARDAARAAAARWPEPWAPAWIDEVVRAGTLAGLDTADATGLVDDVRALLDALPAVAEGESVSRVELAARLFGDAHALDRGGRLEGAAARALARCVGPDLPTSVWARAGVNPDLVSAPALTWNLASIGAVGGLDPLVLAAADAGVPLHVTQLALRRHPVTPCAGVDVLVVENPRLVEAAAELASPHAVVATNGNPSGAVRLLLDQLVAAGADVRYHGDFDAAGLAITSRMAWLGLRPWRMGAADYLDAVAAADADDVALPLDPRPAPQTPWDPTLRVAFDEQRRIVHEERLLPDLLIVPG